MIAAVVPALVAERVPLVRASFLRKKHIITLVYDEKLRDRGDSADAIQILLKDCRTAFGNYNAHHHPPSVHTSPLYLVLSAFFSGAGVACIPTFKLDAGCAPEDAHEQAMAAAAAARREPPFGRDHEEMETLHRELREAQVSRQVNACS